MTFMIRTMCGFSVWMLLSSAALLAGDVAQTGLVFKQPQLATHGSEFGMVFGTENTIYYSASTDGGRTFQPPVVVAMAPALSLGNHRGPRLAFTANAIVITSGVSSPK